MCLLNERETCPDGACEKALVLLVEERVDS
jgi:hypothetical protein